jgi:hypothetical protein
LETLTYCRRLDQFEREKRVGRACPAFIRYPKHVAR